MNSLGFENLSLIEGKIESKNSDTLEGLKEDIFNAIDDKINKKLEENIENDRKRNVFIFGELNKKSKQCAEDMKKIKEKMRDDEEQLRQFKVANSNEILKINCDLIKELSSKEEKFREYNNEFYRSFEIVLQNFGKTIADGINIRFEGFEKQMKGFEERIETKIDESMKGLCNRIEEVERKIERIKDSLELTFSVSNNENEKKLQNLGLLQQKNETTLGLLCESVSINNQKCLRLENTYDAVYNAYKQNR